MTPEDSAKLEHMRQKSAEYDESLKTSMISHLSTLNDGVIAIFITVMMLEIPYPASAAEYPGFLWTILVFLVSFFIIADFWYENKRIFESMKTTDHLTVVADFVFLALLALIPVTTKWIMNSHNRFPALHFGLVYFMSVLGQEFLRYSVLRKRFADHRGLFIRLISKRLAKMVGILIALLLLGWFYPNLAILLYITLPVVSFFLPARGKRAARSIAKPVK